MSGTDLRAALEPLIDEVYQRGMDAPEAADFMVAALRSALTDSRPDSIDAAWAAVEAVLPEGWGVGIEPQADGTYRLGTSGNTTWVIEAEGTTLAAALSYLTLPLSRIAAEAEENPDAV